jgi:hypothetical protein
VQPDSATVRAAARQVAEELAMPEDWFNDGAKGFLRGFIEGPTVFEHPNLVVLIPATEQLLAMKLCAARLGVDYSDIRVLLSHLRGTKEEVWAKLEPYLVPGRELTAGYLFEDLWDRKHEPE